MCTRSNERGLGFEGWREEEKKEERLVQNNFEGEIEFRVLKLVFDEVFFGEDVKK